MKILVFSPHPDDAELGVGGTIAKYTQEGHDVTIALVTIPSSKEKRLIEATRSAEILGAKLYVMGLDEYNFEFNRRAVGVFDKVIQNYSPDIVFTSWIHSLHQDHVNVCKATLASCRDTYCSLYMYNRARSALYAFRPQLFVDITKTMDLKVKSILVHETQVSKNGQLFLDRARAMASYMGCLINTEYAESFEVVREFWK